MSVGDMYSSSLLLKVFEKPYLLTVTFCFMLFIVNKLLLLPLVFFTALH